MSIETDFKSLGLTRSEGRLMERLVAAAPRAATREQLLAAVYAGRPRPKTDRLSAIVGALRKKLGARATIITERGVGYALAQPPERTAAPAIVAPAPQLPRSLMQGGSIRIGEWLGDVARRYGVGRTLAPIFARRPPVAGAIDFARRPDGSFEMRQ